LALGFWVAAWAQSGNPWRDNLTRDDVITALGEPKSSMEMGSKAVLEYDGGVMITFQNGVVTNIVGTVPAALRAGAVSPVAATAPTASVSAPVTAAASGNAPVATPGPVVSTAGSATSADGSVTVLGGNVTVVGPGGNGVATGSGSAVTVVPAAPVAPTGAGTSSTAAKTGGGGMAAAASDDAMINDAANPTLPPEAARMLQQAGITGNVTVPGMGKIEMGAEEPKQNPWVQFAIMLGATTVFLSVVLKVAFMRKDFPVIWRDVVLVAFVTALFYQGQYALLNGNAFYDIIHMLQGDWMVTGALLLWLILTFTEAKQFATAGRITVAAVGVAMVLQIVVAALMF
jgi:hypothetical protein